MNESIRLGRIAGIPIGVSWSALVVGWLLAWSLAAHRLPSAHPGHGDAGYWLVGTARAAWSASSPPRTSPERSSDQPG